MKKILSSLLVLGATLPLAAQVITTFGSNVGIGTTTPGAKLTVAAGASTVDAEEIRFNRTEDGNRYNSIYSLSDDSGNARLSFRVHDGAAATSQATVLTLKGNGNVGIGTTTPTNPLVVARDQNASTRVVISNLNAGAVASATLQFDTDARTIAGALFQTSSTFTGGYGGANALNLVNIVNGPLALGANNDIKMTITGAGNVGIGAASPAAKLHVYGGSIFNQSASGIADYIFGNANGGTDVKYSYIGGASGGYIMFGKMSDNLATKTEYVRIDGSNGNVGIGTSSPTRKLSVYAQYPEAVLKSSAASGGAGGSALYFGNAADDTVGWINYEHNNNALSIRVNSAERVRINSSGYVGIGTAAPSRLLSLNGASNAYLGFKVADTLQATIGTDNNADFFVYDDQTSTYRMVVSTAGNVGIGTNSPADKLHVAGNVLLDGYKSFIARYTTNGSYAGHLSWDHLQMGNNGPNYIVAGNTQAGGSLYFVVNNTNDLTNLYADTYKNGTVAMMISSGGNVGVGTTNPTSKLTVNGTVKAKGFNADSSAWADFVFEDGYRLPSLSEVESHIRTRGHLPDIPSAAEVKANGVDLAAMQVKLLQKVEEMTLYMIEMQKENAQLRREVNELKAAAR